MSAIFDIEYKLMSFCLKKKGKWWASHFFRNKEVNEMYFKLRSMPLTHVFNRLDNKRN